MTGGLKATMAGLLAASRGFGKWQSIPLQRGLKVAVKWGEDFTRLRLARDGGRASLIELRPIVENLPYRLSMSDVVYEYDAKNVLDARWATPKGN